MQGCSFSLSQQCAGDPSTAIRRGGSGGKNTGKELVSLSQFTYNMNSYVEYFKKKNFKATIRTVSEFTEFHDSMLTYKNLKCIFM